MQKKCPYCGGELSPNAQKCRHCGEWVVPPAQRHSFDSYTITEPEAPRMRPSGYRPAPPASRGSGGDPGRRPLPGFFTLFFGRTLFGNYSNYTGRTTRRDFWLAIVSYLIVSLAVSGLCWGLTAVVPYGVDFVLTLIISLIWLALTILPVTALMVRRLNDAAYSGLWLFLLLVPVIGWAALIYFWCLPSFPEGSARETDFAFNVGDGAITVACILIFIIGWLAYDGVLTFSGSDHVTDTVEYDTLDLFERDTIIETAPAPMESEAAPDTVRTTRVDTAAQAIPSAPSQSGYDPDLGYDTAAYY